MQNVCALSSPFRLDAVLTRSFTANPNGTITFTIIRPAFFKDETLGTLVVNTASLGDGVAQEKDFELTHEPKNKTKTKGTIKLKLHYPKSESAPVQQSNKPKSIQDVYNIGDEIGRYDRKDALFFVVFMLLLFYLLLFL
jgi:hypothetical protein